MSKVFINKLVPVFLTVLTFIILSTGLYGLLLILNTFPLNEQILLDFKNTDLLLGIVVYLKTAFDFAIFIGSLMETNPGWQKRIAISVGTALGNAFGTFVMLIVWIIAREFSVLSLIFLFIASVILLRMAQESFEEFLKQKKSFLLDIKMPIYLLQSQLNFINKMLRPILKYFVPDLNLTRTKKLSFVNLIAFSFTIPFILGFNDFAGYIPLSGTINLFGFTLGVMVGHMVLTIGLFALPSITVRVVKHPIVLIGGGAIFIGLGLWGIYQVLKNLIIVI
jgi:hypothetical protein